VAIVRLIPTLTLAMVWQCCFARSAAPATVDPVPPSLRSIRNDSFNYLGSGDQLNTSNASADVMVNISLGPELPVKRAQAILVGTIQSAQAYQCGNKSCIYTGYIVRIDELVSSNLANLPPSEADNIALDMIGGSIVRNGVTLTDKLSGHGRDLTVGGQYLFFLTYRKRGDDYSLVKAWQLSNGVALALRADDIQRARLGNSAYDGKRVELILSDARKLKAPLTPEN
jgi:hypothetical protein